MSIFKKSQLHRTGIRSNQPKESLLASRLSTSSARTLSSSAAKFLEGRLKSSANSFQATRSWRQSSSRTFFTKKTARGWRLLLKDPASTSQTMRLPRSSLTSAFLTRSQSYTVSKNWLQWSITRRNLKILSLKRSWWLPTFFTQRSWWRRKKCSLDKATLAEFLPSWQKRAVRSTKRFQQSLKWSNRVR